MNRFYILLLCTLSLVASQEVEVIVEVPYSPEESTQIVEDLIRLATLITFNAAPEDIYYIPYVKQSMGRHIASPDSSEDDEDTEEMRRGIVQRFIRSKRHSLDGLDYAELRKWMLQELKAYEHSKQKEVEKLQQVAQDKDKEVETAQKKAKYALISTIVTTVGGIFTVAITALLTHYLDNGSN